MGLEPWKMFTLSSALEKALLQHFILYKLEIAYAINKPFPFFESLRDKSFITEGTYRESLEACRNLVPTSRVVYNILTKLENTFNLSLLMTLFSQINLCEYPNLRMILRSFINVSTSYREPSGATPTPLRAPADPAEGSSLQTLLQRPPPQPPPPRHLCLIVGETTAPLQQIHESLDKPPSPSGPAVPLPGLVLGEGSTPVANGNLTSNTKEEDARERPRLPTGTVQDTVIQDASSEPSDPKEPQETPSTSPKKKGQKRKRCIWSSPRKRYKRKSLPRVNSPLWPLVLQILSVPALLFMDPQGGHHEGAASPGRGGQEKVQVVDQRKDDPAWNSRVVKRTQRTRTKCAQTSSSKEKAKEDTVDFLAPTLPVICGEAKGILYKEKLERGGASEKSIQNEKGAWVSPKEFTIEGKMERSKCWRRSVRCGGKSLRELIENGILLCPPGRNLKSKVPSS
ncbi:sp110 nuclear body protein isoform X7 [Heterocephalus glaber]|uniref:Sp110 nuclear body protein isoform X7 n=2 Tax=Heterocephalus glaber TaxID=10181 RepID=A0AAX6S123_HETGA|nr:sp110 nuclear body protein isoform X7 [Heterocephalus glaber]XP_021102648.1 sp110 nuclear body protein isoform X7 [Heterocephalus glaber]XP_021102649.1 sp110 nuclear body protein isoform X7 [Heterocephalus glaber]